VIARPLSMTESTRLWLIHIVNAWCRPVALLLVDALCTVVAFHVAYQLRFEWRVPEAFAHQRAEWLGVLVATRLLLFLGAGLHRWSFRLAGLHEASRLILAAFGGTFAFVTVTFLLRRFGPPRSVIVIECLFVMALLGAVRFTPRLVLSWMLGQRRLRGPSVRTLIVGAGSAGELLLRDLQRSDEHVYDVVGFVDDNRNKWGTSIGGRPVLGGLETIPEVARRKRVEELLFAIPRLSGERLREILASCAELKLRYRSLPVSFAFLNDRSRATLLHELAADDLLPRIATRFSPERLQALLRGRRLLVTGAGGSIGSEICRQAAEHGAATLVLADINENELYLLYRELLERYPGLEVVPEVVDIRDHERLRQIGRQYRPQDVFHAAAHKHVPLMEVAPEEAVKNNVAGTRNVALMADEFGAEKFVLVSTDKAADPSSVMGVTKRLAELQVLQLHEQSKTNFTIVRFGNVLGSAGSVVPLFKAQIAAGGPVTVTDPDCRRYLMTISEAVGLVLLAGLSRLGPLCILEMGEPIRILDLARSMITLSGCVPGRDIPIVFTGLRPGEKLDEVLMTQDEAATSEVVDGWVRVIRPQAPPHDLSSRLISIERLARRGEREALLESLRALVPSYRPFAHTSAPASDAARSAIDLAG
jgi:FlaA1/EpsC-like NDP-sugar epimerase